MNNKSTFFPSVIFFLLVFLSFGYQEAVQAQSIFSNPILGTNPNTNNPYTVGQTVNSNIAVSGIGRGAGINGTNANNRYNANGWDTAVLDETAYFEWVITPNAGFQINFVSLVYTSQASGTGPSSFAIRSSADGFMSNISTPTATGTTVDLSGTEYQGVTSAITFRLYGWGTTNAGGTFSVNDFTFNGFVNPLPSVVSIEAINADASEEGLVEGTFRISRSGSTASDLDVDYMVGGSAGSSDYTPTLSGIITIPTGESFTDITITPINDNLVEGTETLTITLLDGTNYDLDTNDSASINIEDNDFAYLTVSPSSASVNEGAGVYTSNIRLIIDSSPPNGSLQEGVTVQLEGVELQTANGATFDDFTLLTTSVTFPAGSVHNTTRSFEVDIVDDTLVEGNEFFDVAIVQSGYSGVPAIIQENQVVPGFCNGNNNDCRNRQTIRIVDNDVAEYTITTTDNAIVITDMAGNGETLEVTENGTNIRFNAPGRSYTINGGAGLVFPADVPLAGVTSITINTAAGNDIINIGGFAAILPSFTVNGGTGNDVVSFTGDITFAADANLDVDLQNDDPTPGEDQLVLAANANLILAGTGSAVFKVSRNVELNNGSSITTANGNLTMEANQQIVATAGNFLGILVNGGALQTSGTGTVTVKGKGGTDAIGGQKGIYVVNSGQISGGISGTVLVDGVGGPSAGNFNDGVFVDANGAITSLGGNVSVTGLGNGTGSSETNFGVFLRTGGVITAGGDGLVTVNGTGAATAGSNNRGIVVFDTNARITSSGGNVNVTGQGGGTGSSGANWGVYLLNAGQITAGNTGTVTVNGIGGAFSGNSNYGVFLEGINAQITSAGGSVSVTGQGGGSGTSSDNYGVHVNSSSQITAGGSGSVTVQGTGGTTTGSNNYGVAIANTNSRITSPSGNVEVIGTGGGSAADIITLSGGIISSTSTTAGITLNSTTNGTWPNSNGTDVSNTISQINTFSTGSKLNIDIDGLTANTQYQQLGLIGMIDLNDAELTFIGSTHTPALGNTFIIVNNDGTDAVIGTFQGLPEGAAISNFLGSGLDAQITYLGGDGNDIMLTIVEAAVPDYTINTTGNAIIITDDIGNGDVLDVTESSSNIRFDAAGRTYSLNGGATMAFPMDVSLAGTTSITINTSEGDDIINIGGFTTNLPSLTVNGGIGDDVVNFNGDITFAANANLDVDMQNDDPSPGIDRVTIADNTNLILSGTGSATVKVSRNVIFNSGGSLETIEGDLIIEANQQSTPTEGEFRGISIQNATLSSTTGNIILRGRGGNQGFEQMGIFVNSSTIESESGEIELYGNGGPGSSQNYGVRLDNGSILRSTSSSIQNATLRIHGFGGVGEGILNEGVRIVGESEIQSASASIDIYGIGVSNIGASGVHLGAGGKIIGTNATSISIYGEGSNNFSTGVFIDDGDCLVSSQAGEIIVTGRLLTPFAGWHGIQIGNPGSTGNASIVSTNSSISLITDILNIDPRGSVNAVNNLVVIKPLTTDGTTPISLGEFSNDERLGVTNTHLDQITAGTLIIGDPTSGKMTISNNITFPASTNVELFSGDDIEFLAALNTSGSVQLTSGALPAAVKPTFDGTDVSGGTVSIPNALEIVINGTTPGDGLATYSQLNIVGTVDLTGTDLILSGTQTPIVGQTYTIVVNDGVDAVTGTFNGLPEGAIIPNFLGSGMGATITYNGGDGNDVALMVVENNYIITTSAGALEITEVTSNGETISVTENGSNIRFDAVGRFFTLNGGPITAMPANVPLSGLNSITVNTEAGNDIIDIGAFTANLPSLTINGGTGDDVVNFNGDITFAADANLDVDMQNDDATPGVDQVVLASNTNLLLLGAGTATIKVSRNVAVNSGASIETEDGDLIIEANQQASKTSGSFVGISLNGATLESVGTGSVSLIGQGGDAGSNEQIGVQLRGGASIQTNSGIINIYGQGGGSGSGQRNYGFRLLNNGSEITTVGGSVTITGIGGNTTGRDNKGILADVLTSFNIGGTGSLELNGTGGSGTTQNAGIELLASSNVTLMNGNLIFNGSGGGNATASTNRGVFIGSLIDIVGSGAVTISGIGGIGSGGDNQGILFETSSIGGNTSNGVLQTASGEISIEGVEGEGSGSEGLKINSNSRIESTGSGNITLIANNMNFAESASITTAGDAALMQQTAGTAINLGGSDAMGILGLTNIELDCITAGTLILGNSNSGKMTISNSITRPISSDVELYSGSDIEFLAQLNTDGGMLKLVPGVLPAAVIPIFNGTDVAASPVSFDGALAININGTSAGDGSGATYTQFIVAGGVDLTGAELILEGTHTPENGQTFTIVDNDGVNSVIGTFQGLPEGATILNFLGSSFNAQITYIGGDGNDVVLTASNLPEGWSQNPDGIGCQDGNSADYSFDSDIWTATSTNCFYSSPFTSDAAAFAQYTLCGNGSITAQVTGISGTSLGWAGVTMRESNAPGAKKAQLTTNMSNFSRREFRTTTNGAAFPQQFPSQNRRWLRIVRSGNQFAMYVSSNGISWAFAGAQNIQMNSCIEIGLVVSNYSSNSTVTATFANVSVTGGNSQPLNNGGVLASVHMDSQQGLQDVKVYPTPTSGQLNIALTGYEGRPVTLEVYNTVGQIVYTKNVDEVQNADEIIDLSSVASGMYLIRVSSDGLPAEMKRVTVAR